MRHVTHSGPSVIDLSSGASSMNPLTLDLSQFNEGSEAQRERFSGQLRDGLTQHGFVKVVGHGIPKQTVAELFGQVMQTKSFECHAVK